MRRWLPVIFILLVLFGCGTDAVGWQKVNDCLNSPMTTIVGDNSQYLCLKQGTTLDHSVEGYGTVESEDLYVFQYRDGDDGRKIRVPQAINNWGYWRELMEARYDASREHNMYPSIRGGILMALDDFYSVLDLAISNQDVVDVGAYLIRDSFQSSSRDGDGCSDSGNLLWWSSWNNGNQDDACKSDSFSEDTYVLQQDYLTISKTSLQMGCNANACGLEDGDVDQVRNPFLSETGGDKMPILLECGPESQGQFFDTTGIPDHTKDYVHTIYQGDNKCPEPWEDGTIPKCEEGESWKNWCKTEGLCATHSSSDSDAATRSVVMQKVKVDGDSYLNGFICERVGSTYKWKSFADYNAGNDDDNDGSGYIFDCARDNPFKWFPNDFFIEFEIGEESTFSFGESSVERAVCGDGKQDYCELSDIFAGDALEIIEGVFDDNGALKDGQIDLGIEDDCDLNPYSCEHNCLRKGGECDYLTVPNSDPNLADDQTQDESSEEDYQTDDELDYSDFETGEGFCCGDSIGDMGSISEDGEYLCVKNDDIFVSSKEESQMSSACNTPWCWLHTLDAPFEVLTVKQENSFNDYVSNYQEWNICNADNLGNLEYPVAMDGLDETNYYKTSRFSCVQSGDTFMFAECVSNETLSGSHETRTRTMGQSRLSFHMSGNTVAYTYDFGQTDTGYSDIGGWEQNYGADLSNYDFLEFYVKFDEVVDRYPISLDLKVVTAEMSDGERRVIYDQNVLGYSDFPYLVEGEYIRVRVPINNWIDVNEIQFSPSPDDLKNHMSIKTVQAIGAGESELYCSGQQVNTESYAFLDGIDESADMNADINSEDVCKTLFGEDAWFGFNTGSNPEVDEMYAACCGNNADEYYVGSTNYLDGKGCFNSEVMYDGERAANVQYEVKHVLSEPVVSKQEIYLDEVVVDTGYDDFESIIVEAKSYWGRTLLGEKTNYIGKSDYEEDNDNLNRDLPENMYWYDPYNRKQLSDEIYYYDENLLFTLQLYHEYKELSITENTYENTTTFTLPCLEEECVYALPGQPPYEITNNFPGLYDLYFVVGQSEEEQYLITEDNQLFEVYGNILARRVSKNVLMTNETFYSCEVPEYYFDTGYQNFGEQGNRCDVQNGYVCSPQDADSLINTWSNLDLDEIGYTEVTEYVEGMEFQPRTCGAQDPCDVEELEYYVSPVPGRNLVSNADFYMSDGNNLVDWIMYGNGFETDSLPYRENVTVNVPSDFLLKSSKIAIYEDTSYTVTADTSCNFNVYGYSKEGDRTDLGPNFNGAGIEYIELVFGGSDCSVSQPYLSVGSSLSEDFDSRYPARSGAACCPEGACWNGYICVENMASYTFMTENVGEEAYRCIDGDWYNLPPLYDWHGEEIGYCETEGQCFVTSSLSEGILVNASYTDFYNGEYPACINDGEYIFDHLCQDGEWSSRTKFVASSLLNYADGDDHILYCTDVRDALLDYKEDGYNYANYIEGESTTVVENTESLDDAFDGSITGNTTISICYPELTVSETGRRLVPDEDNTCVNNVCTVKYESGGWKTMWGTSVNIDPRDSQSLFVPLGIAGSDTETFCNGDNDTWVECNDNIWFYDSMDSIIYSQEEIGMSQTVTESIVSFLSDLFGTDQIEESEDYLEEASNFNKVYIASINDYTVRAIEEVDGDEETIVAEYTGFETPVCDYVYNVNPSMVYNAQWPAVPDYLVNCTTEDEVSMVITGMNRDFWWPQLTGMLRIE